MSDERRIADLTTATTLTDDALFYAQEPMEADPEVADKKISKQSLIETLGINNLAGAGRTDETVKGNSDRLDVFEGFATTYVRAYRNGSTQSIAHNTSTTLIFPTEISDPGGNYDHTGGIYTVPSDGIYYLVCAYSLSAGAWALNTTARLSYAINGTVVGYLDDRRAQVAASFSQQCQGSTAQYLTAGQQITFTAFQTSGADKVTTGASSLDYMHIIRIA